MEGERERERERERIGGVGGKRKRDSEKTKRMLSEQKDKVRPNVISTDEMYGD